MIEIKDTEICTFFAYNAAGFVVCNQEKNYRSISLEACANHYLKMNENASGRCAGERDILSHVFVFYLEEEPLRIMFEKRFVFPRKHFLWGTRSMRFHSFQKWITDHGYTTYDLS